MKNVINILLLFTLVSCSNANDPNLPPTGGGGSITVPKKDIALVIKTAEDFAKFSKKIAGGTTYYKAIVVLSNDIDLSSIDDFTPIGSESKPFRGTFDGNGYTIKDLKIKTHSQYIGLFGYISDGVIKNLTIENAEIKIDDNFDNDTYIGTFAGSINKSSIESCTNINSKIEMKNQSTSISSTLRAGGIAGGSLISSSGNNYIKNCVNNGEIKVLSSQYAYIGGISSSDVASILNCINNAKITVDASVTSANVGGIVGYTAGATTEVKNCKNSGNIDIGTPTTTRYIGGVIGNCNSSSVLVLNGENTHDINILNSLENNATTFPASQNNGNIKTGKLIGNAEIYSLGPIDSVTGTIIDFVP